jgi:hypothetical protein
VAVVDFSINHFFKANKFLSKIGSVGEHALIHRDLFFTIAKWASMFIVGLFIVNSFAIAFA